MPSTSSLSSFVMKFEWGSTPDSSPSVGSSGESAVSVTGGGGGGGPFVRVLSSVLFVSNKIPLRRLVGA